MSEWGNIEGLRKWLSTKDCNTLFAVETKWEIWPCSLFNSKVWDSPVDWREITTHFSLSRACFAISTADLTLFATQRYFQKRWCADQTRLNILFVTSVSHFVWTPFLISSRVCDSHVDCRLMTTHFSPAIAFFLYLQHFQPWWQYKGI